MPNKIQTMEDGKLSVELETGEKFLGDPLEVTAKLAEAQVNTKRWGQGFKQELETLKSTPPPPAATQPPVDANEAQLQAYLLNQTAAGLGYKSGDEMKAVLANLQGTTKQISTNMALQAFFTQHPEFPGTEAANDVIGKIFDENGWELNDRNLHLAHLEAMDRHRRDPNQGYEPLSAEAVNAAWADSMQKSNRPVPPPMLRGSSPDSQQQGENPWTVSLDKLRQDAIAQQLGQK